MNNAIVMSGWADAIPMPRSSVCKTSHDHDQMSGSETRHREGLFFFRWWRRNRNVAGGFGDFQVSLLAFWGTASTLSCLSAVVEANDLWVRMWWKPITVGFPHDEESQSPWDWMRLSTVYSILSTQRGRGSLHVASDEQEAIDDRQPKQTVRPYRKYSSRSFV
ncbi:uncharacterized protein LY89DRAFT_46537 [Mollisia scopiformis]|uniref:Uncharacterized protein n=1 Tax=Mollisia scopiformis TaxID=149040 RepID=A0A194XF02_MOLSC|nr:uncharacterized protein LY89DRAFT_46537 [Mollisia scopiformis]KUJ18347.1 hypothetical protein LY89DRAFT_46537 [Mollisia scopiformis]